MGYLSNCSQFRPLGLGISLIGAYMQQNTRKCLDVGVLYPKVLEPVMGGTMSNACGTAHTLMYKNLPMCDVDCDVDLGGDSLTMPSVNTNGALPQYWSVSGDGTRELYKAASSRHRHEPANERAATLVMASLPAADDFVPHRLESVDGKSWSVCSCFTDTSREYVSVYNMF